MMVDREVGMTQRLSSIRRRTVPCIAGDGGPSEHEGREEGQSILGKGSYGTYSVQSSVEHGRKPCEMDK